MLIWENLISSDLNCLGSTIAFDVKKKFMDISTLTKVVVGDGCTVNDEITSSQTAFIYRSAVRDISSR